MAWCHLNDDDAGEGQNYDNVKTMTSDHLANIQMLGAALKAIGTHWHRSR